MDSGSLIDEQYRRYLKSRAPKDLSPIFQELAPKLLAAARRAGISGQAAEDVVQETFLAVIEAEDRFDSERSFLAWVRGIALRQMRAERRRQARLASLLQPEHDTESTEIAGRDPAAESVSSTDFQRKVEEAILALSEGNQMVVRAAIFEGLSVDEMAERFDLSNGAVSVRLHRGLTRLRARLKESSSLAVVAFGDQDARGLDFVWKRLSREIHRTTPVKSVASSGVSIGGVMAGALLLGTLGTAAWFMTQRTGGGPVGATSTEGEAEALVDAGEAVAPAAGADPGAHSVTSATIADDVVAGAAASATRQDKVKDLRGIVVSRGVALPPEGAQIFLLESDPDIVLPDEPMTPVATTDEEGVYWLSAADLSPDRTPILIVRHGTEIGWADVPDSAIEDEALPELKLVPELVLATKVVDEFGRPIEGAILSGWTQANRFRARTGGRENETGILRTRQYRHLFGGVTDENGMGLVRGLYGADTPGIVTACSAWKSGYTYGTVALRSPGERRIELEMTLLETKGLSLGGQVTDENGDPVASATISFLLRGETDVSGTAPLALGLDGEWEVHSELLDDYPLQIEFSASGFASRRLYVEQAQELPPGPVVIELSPARPVTGRIVDEADQSLAGAKVTVAVAGEFQEVVANVEGEFETAPMVLGPALITVTATDGEGAQRGAEFSIGADGIGSVLVVPKPDGYAREVTLRLPPTLRKDGWARIELLAHDVKGFAEALSPSHQDGGDAVFRKVPVGKWLACGLTGTGAQVLRSVVVASDEDGESGGTVLLGEPSVAGVIDYVFGPAALGEVDTHTLLARRTNLPRLPEWMQNRAGGLKREILRNTDTERPTTLQGLAPGEWEISASGDGWCTRTQFVVVAAGENVRVDLQPEPASTISFNGPASASAGLFSIEVREHRDQPWSQVGLVGAAPDMETNLTVRLPTGEWEWRSRLQTIRPNGRFTDVAPPAYGTVVVDGAEPIEVDLSSSRVSLDEALASPPR